MKYCPTCERRFDEEIMRFCTKDGTPLVDEATPNFVEMPSESLAGEGDDDPGEITIVRSNINVPPPPKMEEDDDILSVSERPAERIVIPTIPEHRVESGRTRQTQTYYPPPKQNTLKIVFLSVFGTLVVLAMGAGLFWLFQGDRPASNVNTNINVNVNQNANLAVDSNFNFNAVTPLPTPSSMNSNLSVNANTKSPTPTPSTSPTPVVSPSATSTPRPSPSITPSDEATPAPRPPVNVETRPRLTPTPTPRSTPKPPVAPTNSPR